MKAIIQLFFSFGCLVTSPLLAQPEKPFKADPYSVPCEVPEGAGVVARTADNQLFYFTETSAAYVGPCSSRRIQSYDGSVWFASGNTLLRWAPGLRTAVSFAEFNGKVVDFKWRPDAFLLVATETRIYALQTDPEETRISRTFDLSNSTRLGHFSEFDKDGFCVFTGF